MKNLIALILVISLATLACKKKEEEVIKTTFIGLWQGKYGVGANQDPNLDLIFNVRSDGIIKVYNGKDTTNAKEKAVGKWLAIGTQFGANYAYPTNPNEIFSVILTDYFDFTVLEGTWKLTSNNAFGGRMILKRK
jgi:hypothetical protein